MNFVLCTNTLINVARCLLSGSLFSSWYAQAFEASAKQRKGDLGGWRKCWPPFSSNVLTFASPYCLSISLDSQPNINNWWRHWLCQLCGFFFLGAADLVLGLLLYGCKLILTLLATRSQNVTFQRIMHWAQCINSCGGSIFSSISNIHYTVPGWRNYWSWLARRLKKLEPLFSFKKLAWMGRNAKQEYLPLLSMLPPQWAVRRETDISLHRLPIASIPSHKFSSRQILLKVPMCHLVFELNRTISSRVFVPPYYLVLSCKSMHWCLSNLWSSIFTSLSSLMAISHILHGAVESKEQYSAESTPSSLVGSFGSYANHQICLLKYSTNLQMNTAKDSILHLTMNK